MWVRQSLQIAASGRLALRTSLATSVFVRPQNAQVVVRCSVFLAALDILCPFRTPVDLDTVTTLWPGGRLE